MKKRLFSILLALCMVLCLVPTTAFAESETEEPPVCSCETACTAEAMNADCPICGAEGALPENCECSEPIENAEPEGEENEEQPEGEENEGQPEGEVEQVQIADEQFGRRETKHFYILQGLRLRLCIPPSPCKSEIT